MGLAEVKFRGTGRYPQFRSESDGWTNWKLARTPAPTGLGFFYNHPDDPFRFVRPVRTVNQVFHFPEFEAVERSSELGGIHVNGPSARRARSRAEAFGDN